MHRCPFILLALFLLPGTAMTVASDQTSRSNGVPPDGFRMIGTDLSDRIAQWIEQLGDDQFVRRQMAEQELLAIGHPAFDLVKAAESHPDPEISARARRIARQLTVPWTQPGDPAPLHEIMADYGNLTEEQRHAIVLRLQYLDQPELLPALCRIARFDQSSLVACHAALAIAQKKPKDATDAAERRRIISAELNGSQRDAAMWLRTYLVEFDQPEIALRQWRDHTAAQKAAGGNTQYGQQLLVGLLRQQVHILDSLGRYEESLDTWFEMIGLDEQNALGLMNELVTSLLNAKRWDAIERIIEKQGPLLARDPTLLYWIAQAFMEQGNTKKAKEYAQQAFSIPSNPQQRIHTARRLAERGQFEWAEQEYRELINKTPPVTEYSLEARAYLAAILDDDNRHLEAAKLYDDLINATQKDKDAQQMFAELDSILKHIRARRDYFYACHDEQQGNRQAQKKHLDQAIQNDPNDIDVLIAMYHLPDVDDAYRAMTRKKITEAATQLEQNIQLDPETAVHYNNWAWLSANTGGDLDLAVQRAQLAVQKADSDSLAGYIDTLARCYYAKGDIDQAIKYQKQAIEQDPHTKQLKRQLELFEKK